MDTPHPCVLIVDDEVNILSALQRLLRREPFDVVVSPSPVSALELVREKKPALIIADNNMPDMNGRDFLQKARELSPSSLRVMLTGCSDRNVAVEAINRGGIYKFFSKPWNDEELKINIRQAVDLFLLGEENRRLQDLIRRQNEELKELNTGLERKVEERTREIQLKNTELSRLYADLEERFLDSIKVFCGLIDIKSPFIGNHGKRVAGATRFMAEKLNLSPEERRSILIAALLHDIGDIALPDAVLAKSDDRGNTAEHSKWMQHPAIGEAILGSLKGFESIRKIIRHHHENYDGTGFPDKLRGENIPLGSRLIAVADAYDRKIIPRISTHAVPPEKAVEYLKQNTPAFFDPLVLPVFLEFLNQYNRPYLDSIQMTVKPRDLAVGMVLAADLKTASGMLLAAKESVLTVSALEKINNYQRTDPIVDDVLVFRNKKG